MNPHLLPFAQQTLVVDASANEPDVVVNGIEIAAQRNATTAFELIGNAEQIKSRSTSLPRNVTITEPTPVLQIPGTERAGITIQGRRAGIHAGMSQVMHHVRKNRKATFLSDANSNTLSMMGSEVMDEIPGTQCTPFVSCIRNYKGADTLVVSEEANVLSTDTLDPLRSIHRFFMARICYAELMRNRSNLQHEHPTIGWHTFTKDHSALSNAERDAMLAIATAAECNSPKLVTDLRSGEADIIFSSADANHIARENAGSISWLQGVRGGCTHVSRSSNPEDYAEAAEAALAHDVQTTYAELESRIARPRAWSEAA